MRSNQGSWGSTRPSPSVSGGHVGPLVYQPRGVRGDHQSGPGRETEESWACSCVLVSGGWCSNHRVSFITIRGPPTYPPSYPPTYPPTYPSSYPPARMFSTRVVWPSVWSSQTHWVLRLYVRNRDSRRREYENDEDWRLSLLVRLCLGSPRVPDD